MRSGAEGDVSSDLTSVPTLILVTVLLPKNLFFGFLMMIMFLHIKNTHWISKKMWARIY